MPTYASTDRRAGTARPLAVPAAPDPAVRAGTDPAGLWLPMLLGCGLALLLTLPRALEVWQTGVFHNPDDAMRAVQLRDFLAGQGWYDLVPRRLSPGHPFAMHWSRLVDLPLAGTETLFRWAGAGPERAERLMRLLVPPLLFAAALRSLIAIARGLGGSRAALPAALLFAGSTEAVGQFIPGHIHHHGVQATLLLASTALLLRALRSGGSLPAAGAGAVMALSLGVGLQNLPFAIAEAAVAVLAWVVAGHGARGLLASFGIGLAGGAMASFAADVAPADWGSGACDAFSTAHLLAATLGGLGAATLAAATARLGGRVGRMVAALALAILVGAALAVVYPACLHDPMAGVDPLLRREWLAEVGEALPLARLLALDPVGGAVLALTLAGGLLATLAATILAPPAERAPWAALCLLALVGVAGTGYQVRVAPATCAFLVPGVAVAVLRLHARLARRPGRPALLAAVVLGLFGNGAAWAALGVPAARLFGGARGVATVAAEPWACFEPALYGPLAALPPGLVLSTIDPGSAILAATPHAVLAAPYHRNAAGNRVALLAFAATPGEAEAIVRASGAAYLAACRASSELAETAVRHPGSLAAALLSGRLPAWLAPVGTGREPVLLFRVAG